MKEGESSRMRTSACGRAAASVELRGQTEALEGDRERARIRRPVGPAMVDLALGKVRDTDDERRHVGDVPVADREHVERERLVGTGGVVPAVEGQRRLAV